MSAGPGRCGELVHFQEDQLSWWDGEYEGFCELPRDHAGDHWDGLLWFDDDMQNVDHRHTSSGVGASTPLSVWLRPF